MKNSMKIKKLYTPLALLLFILTITGCVNIKSGKYIAQKQYMLNVNLPKKANNTTSKNILLVSNVQSLSEFSGFDFVYRLSEFNYTKDKYNVFFISPQQQIKQITTRYLQHLGLFKSVSDNFSLLTTIPNQKYILYTKILALYADYRNKENPKAVISLRFTLTNEEQIVFAKTYLFRISLQKKNSSDLVQAWSEGLGVTAKIKRKYF